MTHSPTVVYACKCMFVCDIHVYLYVYTNRRIHTNGHVLLAVRIQGFHFCQFNQHWIWGAVFRHFI